MAVQTRAASRTKAVHHLAVPEIKPLNLTTCEFSKLQETCPDLVDLRSKAITKDIVYSRDGSVYQFIVRNNLLYRICLSSKHVNRINKLVLVLL